jgi:hypothetical protein
MKRVRNYQKRKLCESAETAFEKLVKSHRVNFTSAGFSHLEPQCSSGAHTEAFVEQRPTFNVVVIKVITGQADLKVVHLGIITYH